MSTWGNKRKYSIMAAGLVLISIPLAFAAFKILYKTPTCTDNKQNQNENGVDCGGVCDLYCKGGAAETVILWQRLFKVAPGIYSVAVSIQNPNLRAGAAAVPYRIRVFDNEGVSMYERTGAINIRPKYTFPIIEPGILLGERIPSRITFEFLEEPVWIKEEEKITPLTISNEVLYNEKIAPRIEADLENSTVRDIKNVMVGVIMYDAEDNAIAVSKTLVDKVPGSGSAKAVFTWPEPFSASVARKEIVILE
jgi:hypothetical protein